MLINPLRAYGFKLPRISDTFPFVFLNHSKYHCCIFLNKRLQFGNGAALHLSWTVRSYFLQAVCSEAKFGEKQTTKKEYNCWNVYELPGCGWNQRDDTEQWHLSPAPALSAVSVLCYLINRVSVGVICHPCPPDHRVFCSAGVPHHQLPTEQATWKDKCKTSEVWQLRRNAQMEQWWKQTHQLQRLGSSVQSTASSDVREYCSAEISLYPYSQGWISFCHISLRRGYKGRCHWKSSKPQFRCNSALICAGGH